MSGDDPAVRLDGRRVAVYVSGSIAAPKACEVVTGLRRLGAEVRVAMTEAGARFVSPMTFHSLSGNPVAVSVWDAPAPGAGQGHGMTHIALSGWAEVQVAVPASADLCARLALGLAGDAVTAAALACPAPLVVVPAMETAMWEHPATRGHLDTLRARGAGVVGPTSGRLASGREGQGRMAEPAAVVAAVARILAPGPGAAEVPLTAPSDAAASAASAAGPGLADGDRWLAGRRVVITAGGTREPIDPVRYLGNRSSGKMGNALVAESLRLGARVSLVTAAPPPPAATGLEVVEVATAAQMLEAAGAALPGAALLIMAAAVADYRVAEPASRKLKKRDARLQLELVPTVDVLATLAGDPRRAGVVLVGFAAETDDLLANAERKLAAKGLDLIVANDVGAAGIGMGSDDNAVTIIGRQGVVAEVGPAPKPAVAAAVLAAVRPLLEVGAAR